MAESTRILEVLASKPSAQDFADAASIVEKVCCRCVARAPSLQDVADAAIIVEEVLGRCLAVLDDDEDEGRGKGDGKGWLFEAEEFGFFGKGDGKSRAEGLFWQQELLFGKGGKGGKGKGAGKQAAPEEVFSLRARLEPFLFEFVWSEMMKPTIRNVIGEVLHTWTAAGWVGESEMEESIRIGIEREGAGVFARGLTRERAEIICAMLSGAVECDVVEDRPAAAAAAALRSAPPRPPRPRPTAAAAAAAAAAAMAQAPTRGPMSVEREHLLCSALGPVLQTAPRNLRPGALTVKYQGESAQDGVGGAGVTRAFLTQVGALVADARLGLVLPALKRHHQLSPCPGLLAPRAKDGVARQPERWSRFLGRVLGMAVAHECPLGLSLVPSLCRQLLGQEAEFDDLRFIPAMECYHSLYRRLLAHREPSLVPAASVQGLTRATSVQVEKEIDGLPAEIPSKTQLVFEALLLRVEEVVGECDWEEAVDVAACLLREARTPDQSTRALQCAEKLLLRITPALDDDDEARDSDEEQLSGNDDQDPSLRMSPKSSPMFSPKMSPKLSPKLSPKMSPKLSPKMSPMMSPSDPSSIYLSGLDDGAEQINVLEGLPRALQALRAALPDASSSISAPSLERDVSSSSSVPRFFIERDAPRLRQLVRRLSSFDFGVEGDAVEAVSWSVSRRTEHEGCVASGSAPAPARTQQGQRRRAKKKRGGGVRRAERAAIRAMVSRARILDLEATPTDWYYPLSEDLGSRASEDCGYYTLSVQGDECYYSELNLYGIISGALRRAGGLHIEGQFFEGDVFKTKDCERVKHGRMRIRIMLDKEEKELDYCLSNFLGTGDWQVQADQGWRPLNAGQLVNVKAGDVLEYTNEYGSYRAVFTSTTTGTQENTSRGTTRRLRRVEPQWSSDMRATRIPAPQPATLKRERSQPTEDEQLSRDNLATVAEAAARKVLAGNLPHLSAVAEELRRVVPDDLFRRLSRKVEFVLPHSDSWGDALKALLRQNSIAEEDKEFVIATEFDGTRIPSFFREGAEDPRSSLTSARFPLHFHFSGWRKLQRLISGSGVDVDSWRSKTIYRLCTEEDDIVQLWWQYVAGCAAKSYDDLRELFQWCTGWPSSPHTSWKFQVCVVDEPEFLQPGRERLPAMILCMTDDDSAAGGRGVKTPTLNLPKYQDRWEVETIDGWRPFDAGVPFTPGEDFDCPAGFVSFASPDAGSLIGEDCSALRRVSARETLERKMLWAVHGGANMDAM